jgi:transcriptional regulator with XRE-family HTH domain
VECPVDDLSAVARELRIARENLGLSREQLAATMGYSPSYIEKVETGKLAATEAYVRAAAALSNGIDTEGLFGRLRNDGLRRKAIGDWLRDWLHIEQQASVIRWFEPDLAPGLLQVEGYAQALLRTEAEVAMRLERQEILGRDEPPEFVAIVNEHALHRRVGSPAVMHEQLVRLAADTRAVVQVLPTDTDTYAGCDGSFVLATVGDRVYVYVDTPAQGFTLEGREVVSRVQRQWEAIRGEALTSRQSRELILKEAERWKAAAA